MANDTVKGSCLCGSVKYEVTGHTERFYHCTVAVVEKQPARGMQAIY